MNEELVYKTNYVNGFENLASKADAYEVGISFEGETKVSEDMSVITSKEVKCENAAEAKDTYLKVMEMRELTKEEEELAEGARGFLKKVFKEIGGNSIFWPIWIILLGWFIGDNVSKDNLFGILIGVICLSYRLRPIKFYKLIRGILKNPERIDELGILLHERHVSGYVHSVNDADGIKLYMKYRNK